MIPSPALLDGRVDEYHPVEQGLPIRANFYYGQAERLSPQIRAITGNKRWGASFLETNASTAFSASSGIASSLEAMTIGICGLTRFISIATS